MKNMGNSIKNFLFLLKPIWKYGKCYSILSVLIAVVLTPISSLCNVLFTQNIVDAVASEKSYQSVLQIICQYLLIQLLVSTVQSIYDIFYNERASFKIEQKMKDEIYQCILRTDYEYFDDPSFYNNYTWAVNEYIGKAYEAKSLFINLISSVAIVITMSSTILLLGPWILVITIIEILINTYMQSKQNKVNLEKRETNIPIERRLGYVHQAFSNRANAADIRTTKVKDILYEIYDENTTKKSDNITRFSKRIFSYSYPRSFIGIIYNGLILGYISYGIIISKKIDGVGKFTSLLSANTQLVNALSNVFNLFTIVDNLSLYAEKIKGFFTIESKIENQEGGCVSSDSAFSLAINNLSFSYSNSCFGLKNINMTISAGEKVAIVGVNGSGKTTFMKLLLRLYDPTEGDILYNGISIKEYNLKKLRSKVGIAFQSINVYATTLSRNLQLYNHLPEDQLLKNMEKVELLDVLQKNGSTLNTELTRNFSADGIMLSTGEKQKLGIARIMAQDFGLLLLDEPSATLDPISEYKLAKLIFDTANRTTSIIISHRLSMIRNADRIYVMNDGSIIENGTHEELLALKGLYYDMFTKQSEGFME